MSETKDRGLAKRFGMSPGEFERVQELCAVLIYRIVTDRAAAEDDILNQINAMPISERGKIWCAFKTGVYLCENGDWSDKDKSK